MALDVNIEKEKSSNALMLFVETIARKVFKSMFVINTHVEGVIVSELGSNKYNVQLINGEKYDLYAREGLTLSAGNVVLVCQVNADINKRFIDCKRPY